MVRAIIQICLFAVLGGFCALTLIFSLCGTAKYSGSSYCMSVAGLIHTHIRSDSQPTSGSIHTSPSCTSKGNCLNATVASRVVQTHLLHVHLLMDLVEGTGLPPGKFFDVNDTIFYHIGSSGLRGFSEYDKERQPFVDNIRAFCRKQSKIQLHYGSFLGAHFLRYFRPSALAPVYATFKSTIESLWAAEELEKSTSGSQQYTIQIDGILRQSLTQFFDKLQEVFAKLAVETPAMLDFFAEILSLGQRVSEQLDSELPRVQTIYHKIPWWDSIPRPNFLRRYSQRTIYEKYYEFLTEEAPNIRDLVEQVSIILDHLTALNDYFRWYSARPDTLNVGSLEGTPSAIELFRLLEEFQERVRSDWDLHSCNIPPRRMIGRNQRLPLGNGDPS
ncbi:uncharacterized protein EV420DRAFT_1551506 [Desarmillaria tabescens]|uniref:Uncharacterized protein n=1 Tax=Armillaria tabescens TaxID=1929756 RepID=A0AA39N4G5_ARMTA|nr:uncharacterized protein EV420DRAFT_1551506 [Desarmillaria tabescens]KAK0457113.1 hypothetical protein EV420DRAFT_1551506 [Desarmillaria tabescens]